MDSPPSALPFLPKTPLPKLFSLLILLLLSPLSSSNLFDSWCAHHNKSYASEREKLARFRAFEDNLAFIEEHNSRGNSSYALGLNAFADLTHGEFRSTRFGLGRGLELANRSRSVFWGSDVAVPDSIDWRKKGAVTQIKDQGSCGM